MTIKSHINEDLLSSYTSWTATHVPINQNGSIIHRRNYLIQTSYQTQERTDDTNHWLVDTLSSPFMFLECCPTSIQTRHIKKIHSLSLPPQNSESLLEEYLNMEHGKKDKMGLQVQILRIENEEHAGHIPPQSLLTSVIDCMSKNGIQQPSIYTIKKVMKLYQTALSYKERSNADIVCVSSKSPFLQDLNAGIILRNSFELSKATFQGRSEKTTETKASIRIFPDHYGASISFPQLERVKGGVKTINQEFFIDRNQRVDLVRRCKLKKELRQEDYSIKYLTTIERLYKVQSDHLLKPTMIFSTRSKGVEYFVENFDLDLFSFFEQYYAFANRTHATYKKKYPQIEEESLNKQVCDLIQILEDICRGLYDLHSQNLLHNDIKPENILIKRDQNGFITKISDFDFLTTIEEGLYLTELLGSHGYLRDSEYARSIETDLFSLARTIDNQMRSDLPSPSFVEVFDILEELTKTKFKEESLKISMVKTKLIELACQLSYGTIQEGETVFPDLRNIIKLLQEMKQPFL